MTDEDDDSDSDADVLRQVACSDALAVVDAYRNAEDMAARIRDALGARGFGRNQLTSARASMDDAGRPMVCLYLTTDGLEQLHRLITDRPS